MKLAARWRHFTTAVTGRGTVTTPNIRMAGAGLSRLTRGWNAYQQSIDDALSGNIGIMRARARQLVTDNGEASGLLLDFESDIVGAAGPRLQFRATKVRGTPLDALNDRIEGAFAEWGTTCTLDDKHDFASLARLMIRTVIVDGEFFALKHRGRQYKHGYALQPIDADQVDDTYNVAPNADGVSIVMGVEVNSVGRKLAYYIWDRHPYGGQRGERRRVLASDVVHVYKQLRIGQTRGVTWFGSALVTWKLGDQYTESELVQSMLAAAQGGFFVNKNGDGAFPTRTVTLADGTKREVPIEIEASPGVSRALPGGWEWQAWQPTHPTANFVGFMKAVKRIIGRCFGRSYASITGDLSDANYSSMRTDRVREMDQNRMHQEDLLVRQFARVVFADWFVMADVAGALGVLPRSTAELVPFASWMCRGWPWIDPLKDAATAQLEMQMRVNSPQRICAARGLDFYEVVNEIADAQTYAKSKGVSMDAVDLALSFTDAAPAEDGKSAPSRTLRLTA